MAFKKYILESMEEEEYEEPNEEITCLPENHNEEPEQLNHPMKQCEPIESVIVPKTRKFPSWLDATLQEEEKLKSPSGTLRERKKTQKILQLCNMYEKSYK
jgi:hypothetical protein